MYWPLKIGGCLIEVTANTDLTVLPPLTWRPSFRYLNRCVKNTCNQATCHTEDLPRTYNAYHLNGQTINMDGKLDDPAWDEVPWSDSFMGGCSKFTVKKISLAQRDMSKWVEVHLKCREKLLTSMQGVLMQDLKFYKPEIRFIWPSLGKPRSFLR